MRLHFSPYSSNSRRAIMTSLHLGLDVELVPVDLFKREQKQPDFLRLNPNGRVPVLEDDGFVLTESHAIMQYLADKTPGQTLYPTELRARADVNRWLFWSAHHFQPAVSVLGWEYLVKPMLGAGPADPKEIARGERLVAECGRVLDGQLAGRQWVTQDRLTLADLALVAPLQSMYPAKLPLSDFPHLQAWFGRMQELDAWKRTGLR
jgi:glutathione S-transferase